MTKIEGQAESPTQNQLAVTNPKSIMIDGERFFSTINEPTTIARISVMRQQGDITAALGLVVPLISEAVGYFAGLDTKAITLGGLASGAAGLGMSRFFMWVDRNSYLPESWLLWEQRPQLDSSIS